MWVDNLSDYARGEEPPNYSVPTCIYEVEYSCWYSEIEVSEGEEDFLAGVCIIEVITIEDGEISEGIVVYGYHIPIYHLPGRA